MPHTTNKQIVVPKNFQSESFLSDLRYLCWDFDADCVQSSLARQDGQFRTLTLGGHFGTEEDLSEVVIGTIASVPVLFLPSFAILL
jgi:hypothetical protein